MRIALVGTRGVPARYGGFETCVEQVGLRLVRAGHKVVVYCRTPHDQPRPASTRAATRDLPTMRKKSLETLSHTALSTSHLMRHKVDAAIVFNAANAVFLPLLQRVAFRSRRMSMVSSGSVQSGKAPDGTTTERPKPWRCGGPTR